METVDFWQGEFGNAYTERNRVEWQKRVPFWRRTIPKDVGSVLEVGCNAAWNLRAIRAACDITGTGVDVNERALLEAAGAGFEVHRMAGTEIGRLGHKFDLVFTAGVLIHVAPDDLEATMRAIIDASKRYVIAVEYAFPVEREVEYRGHSERLWKRPYGVLYQDLGLKCVGFGSVGERDGFDLCAWWIYSKEA